MAKTKQSTSSKASPATPSNDYASFAAGTGPYPNQNVYYNPKSDPTGGYGALSNFDFSPYAGNKGAIKELGQAYGISLSPEQLDLYAKNPQSLGSLRAGGTSSYQGGPQQSYGYSGPYGGMATSGGIPLGTLMMMRGQGQQPQGPAGPPPAPTGPTGSVMNPLQLPSQQVIGQTPQAPQQVPQQVQPPVQQPFTQAPQQQPLSGQNVLNPIPVQLQPVQQYQQGGLVTDPNLNLGGGNQQNLTSTDPSKNPALYAYLQGTGPYPSGMIAPTTYAQNNPLYGTNQQGLISNRAVQYANATNLGQILGAGALNMPMVVNQLPSSQLDPKSGVAQVGGALLGAGVPAIPQGPWLTNPSVFARATPYTPTAAPTVTPQTPATAVAYAPGQPFATPPAAPSALPSSLPPAMAQSGATTARPPTAMLPPGFMGGAQGAGYVPQAFLQAHTSALADAGKALYAHFGGDPNSASPADIANFHSQLTGAVGQHIAGANQPAAGVKQAATGGLVPGQGNKDTVPALLTPGEYVIPKEQVAQLAARGVLRLNSGGEVPDNQSNEPPEARRQGLTVSQPSSSSAQTSSLQVPGGSSLTSGLAQAAHTYGSAMGGGRMGGGVDLRNTPADPDPDLPYLKAAGMGGGAGGGLSSAGAQSALGGVASGLGQAAQAIASSAQPWQVQQSAIPDPSQLPKYQIPTLQAQRVA